MLLVAVFDAVCVFRGVGLVDYFVLSFLLVFILFVDEALLSAGLESSKPLPQAAQSKI